MPILAMSSGTVSAIWGAAFLRLPDGQLKPLKVGDKVQGGQQVVTEDDGLVQITPEEGAVAVRARPIDTVINDLNQPLPQEPTEAGLVAGAGGSSLGQGLRVERVTENVTPLAFEFATARELPPPIFALTDDDDEGAEAAPVGAGTGAGTSNDAEVTVYESSLVAPVAGEPSRVSGTLPLVDAAGQPVAAQVLAPTEALQTLDGQLVQWLSDGQGGLVGRAGSASNAPVVATLSVTPAGDYTFALLQAVKHAAGADALSLTFGVQGTGANASLPTGSLTVTVVDDQPRVPSAVVTDMATLDTNVLIVLDTSNSMNAASGIGQLSRLQAAIEAINQLLQRYDQQGDVKVRLVTFATDTKDLGGRWLSVAEAKAELSAIQLDGRGYTNYDRALASAQTAFDTAGKLGGAQNVSYFLSDGNPSLSSRFPSIGPGGQNGSTQEGLGDGIDAGEELGWRQFIEDRQIRSLAVGMGTDITSTRYLDPIAVDGHAASDLKGVVVQSFTNLADVLVGTTLDAVSGRLVPQAGGLLVSGADGLSRVESITIGGQTFVYDVAQPELKVTTPLGGEFVIDMNTSAYRYLAPASHTTLVSESVAVQLQDRDGDVSNTVLRIQLGKGVSLVGTDGGEEISAGANSGYIMGRGGDDTLIGGDGLDVLYGNDGQDVLRGGLGRDILLGGAGNDISLGGDGADVFAWRLDDRSLVASAPALDLVRDFDVRAPSAGGDALDLRDLLVGENTAGGTGNLDQYLRFEFAGADTVLHVSSQGGFTPGDTSLAAENQRIVLEGQDLRTGLGLGAGALDQAIIARMLEQGKLLVDAT